MTDSLPDSVGKFIDRVEPSEKTLMVINRSKPEPLVNLLERGLDDQAVDVADRQFPEGVTDLVCLIEAGEVVATSSLARLEESYLLVNADRYRTGTSQIDVGSFPDVLTGLDEIAFTVRGYPESAKEKLLLILVSRFIEFRALQAGAGRLRSTFQRLSRLDDELGTRTVYGWLGDSDIETHVYGINDDPAVVADLDVITHSGSHNEYRRSWVVLFTPPDQVADGPDRTAGPDGAGHVALVAVETEPNVWRGTWTYDPGFVSDVERYLRERF